VKSVAKTSLCSSVAASMSARNCFITDNYSASDAGISCTPYRSSIQVANCVQANNESNGMQRLKDVLTNKYGLNLSGWSLTDARGVSADGLTIVGWGKNLDGRFEAWIATIPEPTTIALFVFSVLCLGKRRRVGM